MPTSSPGLSWPQIAVDGVAWLVALTGASALRVDFEVSRIDGVAVAAAIAMAAVLQVGAGWASGLYRGRWRVGSSDEVLALAGSVTAVTLVLGATDLAFDSRPIPFGVLITSGLAALVMMGGVRFRHRRVIERRMRPASDPDERLLIFGAGAGGEQVIDALLRAPSSRIGVVALLDDDARKGNLRIRGIPVVGDRSHIADAAAELDADTLLIAIPTAPAETIRELTALAMHAGLAVKMLPPVHEIFGGPVGVADIRTPSAADLLGRTPVELDLNVIAQYLTGKRVLVTGAGGSIGSELCRQIVPFEPAELIMLDHDETGLHSVQLSLEGRALLDTPALVLADIRDQQRMFDLFHERKPDVVFHAAALKHLPLLEQHPAEALRTNVWATWHVLDAAARCGVERFVNISTDKAADPTSVLGFSKALAERVTAHVARTTGRPYLSVRFGNVLRSRGSVLNAFDAQAATGGPLTVTDPDATRFFMTTEEAVQLVIQAGADGAPGEVLVLDMGEPIRIADVARRFVEASDRHLEIVYTGLRPGEKLHEVLLGEHEQELRRTHRRISHVQARPLDPQRIAELDAALPTAELRDEMQRLYTDSDSADVLPFERRAPHAQA